MHVYIHISIVTRAQNQYLRGNSKRLHDVAVRAYVRFDRTFTMFQHFYATPQLHLSVRKNQNMSQIICGHVYILYTYYINTWENVHENRLAHVSVCM